MRCFHAVVSVIAQSGRRYGTRRLCVVVSAAAWCVSGRAIKVCEERFEEVQLGASFGRCRELRLHGRMRDTKKWTMQWGAVK